MQIFEGSPNDSKITNLESGLIGCRQSWVMLDFYSSGVENTKRGRGIMMPDLAHRLIRVTALSQVD